MVFPVVAVRCPCLQELQRISRMLALKAIPTTDKEESNGIMRRTLATTGFAALAATLLLVAAVGCAQTTRSRPSVLLLNEPERSCSNFNFN